MPDKTSKKTSSFFLFRLKGYTQNHSKMRLVITLFLHHLQDDLTEKPETSMQLQTFLNSNSKFIKPPSVYHIHTEGGLYYPYGFIGWSHPPNP